MKKHIIWFLLVMTNFPTAWTQSSLEELKAPILAVKELYFYKKNPSIDAVTDFNGHLEFWTFDSLDIQTHSLQITSYQDQTFFMEIYLVQDGKLIYALEEEKDMPFNHHTQSIWRCEYFIRSGRVFDYTSLGSGKTEDDNWNPEDIITQFSDRKSIHERIFKR